LNSSWPGSLLAEIERVIDEVDASVCRIKVSSEKTMFGRMLFSPKAINLGFKEAFRRSGWDPVQTYYWVCEDAETNRRVMDLPAPDQKTQIAEAGFTPYRSMNQTDFVKDRVAVEVQLGKYAFVAYDLFVKHLAFYVAGKIDVGIEIVPMKALQAEMSSGPGYYEAELYNLIREGRGVPPVPLVMFGIEP
jgi:hypothetical protein